MNDSHESHDPHERPVLGEYLVRDWILVIQVFCMIGVWVLLVLKFAFEITIRGVFTGATNQEAFFASLAVTFVCFLLSTWRYFQVRSIVLDGVIMDATITYSSTSRIRLLYMVDGKEIDTTIDTPMSASEDDLAGKWAVDRTVRVLVHPKKVRRVKMIDN